MKKMIALTISLALILPNLSLAAGPTGKAGPVGAAAGVPEVFGPVFQEQAEDLLSVLRPAVAKTNPTLSAFLSHIDAHDEGQRTLLGPFKRALIREETVHGQADPNQVIEHGLKLLREKTASLQETANSQTSTPYQLSQALAGMQALAPFLQAYQPEISESWQEQQRQTRARLNNLLDNNTLAREAGSAEALQELRRGEDAPDMDDAPVRPVSAASKDLHALVAEPLGRMRDRIAQALAAELASQSDISQKERAVTRLADLAMKSQERGLLRLAMETLSAEQEKASDVGYQDDIEAALSGIFDSIGENSDLFDLQQELHEHINLGHIYRAMNIAKSGASLDMRDAAGDIVSAVEHSFSGQVRLLALESLEQLKTSTSRSADREFIQKAIDGISGSSEEDPKTVIEEDPKTVILEQALESHSEQLARTVARVKPDSIPALLRQLEQKMYLHTGKALVEEWSRTLDSTELYSLVNNLIQVGQKTEDSGLQRMIVEALISNLGKTPYDSPYSNNIIWGITAIAAHSDRETRGMVLDYLRTLRDSSNNQGYRDSIQKHIGELEAINAKWAQFVPMDAPAPQPQLRSRSWDIIRALSFILIFSAGGMLVYMQSHSPWYVLYYLLTLPFLWKSLRGLSVFNP